MRAAGLRVRQVKLYRSELNNGFHSTPNSIKVDAVFFCKPCGSYSYTIDKFLTEVCRAQSELGRRLTHTEAQAVSYGCAVAVATSSDNWLELDVLAQAILPRVRGLTFPMT